MESQWLITPTSLASCSSGCSSKYGLDHSSISYRTIRSVSPIPLDTASKLTYRKGLVLAIFLRDHCNPGSCSSLEATWTSRVQRLAACYDHRSIVLLQWLLRRNRYRYRSAIDQDLAKAPRLQHRHLFSLSGHAKAHCETDSAGDHIDSSVGRAGIPVEGARTTRIQHSRHE